MNTNDLRVVLFIVAFCFIGFLVAVGRPSKMETEDVKALKLSTCIDYTNHAIPDPNDTEARSKFLQDCFEK